MRRIYRTTNQIQISMRIRWSIRGHVNEPAYPIHLGLVPEFEPRAAAVDPEPQYAIVEQLMTI